VVEKGVEDLTQLTLLKQATKHVWDQPIFLTNKYNIEYFENIKQIIERRTKFSVLL